MEAALRNSLLRSVSSYIQLRQSWFIMQTAEAVQTKLISLNVARPRLVVYKGETINTGIFKQPVTGSVRLRELNLDGDRQADLSVHGGPFKAVYGYPSEHYEYWRHELPGRELPWG